MTPRQLSLLQGTLDLLVLRALANGPQHGYGVAAWVREVTDGTLEVEEGALYTALHRMEKRGWLGADWGVSENNRRAKFYRLTPKGEKQLGDEARTWTRYAEAMGKALDAEGAGA